MAWRETQREKHPGKTIFNICDNARYYHCEYIKEWLKQNHLCQVIYLPAYSPNLNPMNFINHAQQLTV